MRIVLESDSSIRLLDGDAGLVVDGGAGVGLSPLHLLAASLATCTRSVLDGWAREVGLPTEALEIRVEWDLGCDPVQVSALRLDVDWPGLPAPREAAARRVAGHCTIHHTLISGTSLSTRVHTSF